MVGICNQLLLNSLRVISQKYGRKLQWYILKGEDLTLLLFLNPLGVPTWAFSSLFGAICFRCSTSIWAYLLSHCKGTIFCRIFVLSLIIYGFILRAVHCECTNNQRSKRNEEKKSIILEGVQSSACLICSC